MPSSTSSSDDASRNRAPELRWSRVWILVVVAVVGLLGGLEAVYRANGYRPSVTHTKGLWAWHRARANGNDGRVLALVGASRIQLGFSSETFRTRYPGWRVVQLALPGAGPVATLANLARDPEFTGVALVSANGRWLDRSTWTDQQPFVDYFEVGASSWQQIAREVMRAAVQSQLSFTASGLGTRDLAEAFLANGTLPAQRYVTMKFDRSRDADFALLDDLDIAGRLQRLRGHYEACTDSMEDWRSGARELDASVEAIAQRGGGVAFAVFPTSGAVDELLEAYFPRSEAWDRFARDSRATAIHFKDHASLASFECPDGAHLDMRDKAAFTDALIDLLVADGLLPRS